LGSSAQVGSIGFITWDYQLVLTHFANNLASAVPYTNLVSNVGFRADATHTTGSSSLSELPTASLGDPNYPEVVKFSAIHDARSSSMYQSSFLSKTHGYLRERFSRH
jgi:hypothetical protein